MMAPPALRHPLFVRVWAGGVVSAVGTQMSNVAKAWVLYAITGSAVALGIEGLCFSLPIMLLPLLTGPLTDRLPRTAVLQATMAAEAVLATALAATAATGTVRPWMLYLTAALEASRLALDIPARNALIATLVPAADLHSAQSLSSVVYSSSALIGPALGGVLLAVAGPAPVFALNAVSSVLALIAFRPVSARLRQPATAAADGRSGPPRLFDGARFAGRNPAILRLLVVLFSTSTLVIGTETLLPVLDQTRWHGGPIGYGLLRMAPGIAALVTGVFLSLRPQPASPGRAILLSGIVAGGALVAFPLAPRLWIAFALLAIGSVAVSAAQVFILTGLQQRTPDRVRGAVGGFTAMTQSGFAGVAAAGMALGAGGIPAPAVIIAVAAATAATAVLGNPPGRVATHDAEPAGQADAVHPVPGPAKETRAG
ncbi:MFS transporter [Dactylosporangium sp. CS-047395]|uniref:MFS transporter n=1 Tax=Dactylosporangium sp. CS-047395 TaxID=3239936 RepID=UPI003D8B1AAA